MMKNILEQRNLTVAQFKKKYPRLYKKIITMYGGRSVVFDPQAAVCMYLNGSTVPVCDVCNGALSITKKFRSPDQLNYRCKPHINTNNIIEMSTIVANNIHGYEIIHVPKNANISSYITVKCQSHGEYSPTLGNFLKGMRCQKCFGKYILPRITTEEWRARSEKCHGSFYDYSSSMFTTMDSDVTIICPSHGEFTQNAGVHSRGHGCNKCSTDRMVTKLLLSTSEFINLANAKHNFKYTYNDAVYDSARVHVDITCPTHGTFSQVAYYHLAGNGCPQCGIQLTTNKSSAEYEIIDFLKSLGITNIEHSWRGLGFEIDIYLPDHKLAIEYNGVYWHSSQSKDTDKKKSTQHLMKTIACEQNDIKLLHILDLEWSDSIQKKIWQSSIKHHVNKTPTRIFARKCTVVHVSGATSKQFFENNHLQGSVIGSLNLGLLYNGQLVSVASFGKARFNKKSNYHELLRFASVIDTAVLGGFSKIINEFKKTHAGTLVSYANRRWSTGNVYNQCGFVTTHTTDPCYYYTNCKKLWHRVHFQKNKLSLLLKNFDQSKSETENMYANNYRRIWDCGQIVYEMNLSSQANK